MGGRKGSNGLADHRCGGLGAIAINSPAAALAFHCLDDTIRRVLPMWPLPSLRRFQRAVFPLGATSRHAAVIALVWALLIGGQLAGMDSIVLAGMLVTSTCGAVCGAGMRVDVHDVNTALSC